MATMSASATKPRELELRREALGAAPIVGHFIDRMRLDRLLAVHLAAAESRSALGAGAAVGVVVRNLCLGREPLYRLGEWAAPFEPRLLGLAAPEVGLVNDDRVGRALDRLFAADRASLLVELVLGAIREFEVDACELHNDSTSISVHGAYERADGRRRGATPTVAIARGHSKDRRPDLKQLVWILTVARDGALPLAHRLCDGNTADKTTHVETWEGLRSLAGRPDFLYVADSALATGEQMRHIDRHRGRFVCVLPRTRKEDRLLREWMVGTVVRWSEAARRPARRRSAPEDVWSVAPAPIRSAEGYRIVWVHSTRMQATDEKGRRDRLARARRALERLAKRLAGPRCRFRERGAVERAAREALRTNGVEGLVRVEVSERIEERVREESRGPGRTPARRRLTRKRFALRFELDEDAVAHEATSDGCYPLISNDRGLTDAELLLAYRYQPNLEKRHHQLKGVQEAAPVFLKSPPRIEALFCCHFLALLCSCLIERELRRGMAREGIDRLPLYPEERACAGPTAARVFELFAPLARHRLLSGGEPVGVFEPKLSELQEHLLELLGVPRRAYLSAEGGS